MHEHIVSHATDTVIARGATAQIPDYDDASLAETRRFDLYLDDDGAYRWYEEGRRTDACGATLKTALSTARRFFPLFEMIEVRGTTFEPGMDFEDSYAVDEIANRKEQEKSGGRVV